MSKSDVLPLFRRAVNAQGGPENLSAEAEYGLRHEHYVMETPQSRERIRGRDAMLSPPHLACRSGALATPMSSPPSASAPR
jgi:hypothetical protein